MEDFLHLFHNDQPITIVWMETFLSEWQEDINNSFSHIEHTLKKKSGNSDFIQEVSKEFYFATSREERVLVDNKKDSTKSGKSFYKNLKHALLRKSKEPEQDTVDFLNSVIDRTIFFEKSQISKTAMAILDGYYDEPKSIDIYSNSSRYFFKGLLFYDFSQNPISYFKYDIFTKSLTINDFTFKPEAVNATIKTVKTHKPDVLTSVKIWTFLGKEAVRNRLSTTVTVEWVTESSRIGSCELSFLDENGQNRTHFVYFIATPKRIFTSIFRRAFRPRSIQS